MKITAGLGSIDEYVRYVEAGADEFFCGYVPYEWNRKYGTILPLNRREVLGINVQIGAESELRILAALMRKYGNKYESYRERKEVAIADLKRDGIIVHTSKVMNDYSKEVYEMAERNLLNEIY